MPFIPTEPQNGEDIDADVLRDQFNALNDNITTIPKGDKGDPGDKGDKGDQGNGGDKGDKGDQGNPGEVSNAQLNTAIGDALIAAAAAAAANSSANTNGVALIDTSGISDPVQLLIADKINEVITTMRR